MAGWVHMRVSLIKGGMDKYAIRNPIFKPSPITPTYKDYLIFEGISVDEQGKQHYLDVNVAYRQACLNAIEYLKKFGYSGAQAYSILGCAPVQGHISGVVDIPNSCATLLAADRDLRFRHPALGLGTGEAHQGWRRHAAVARSLGARIMPIYDYACGGCGEFSALRPLAQWRDPADCPQCGASSERIGRRAGHLGAVVGGEPRAANERSANEPRSSRAGHGMNCGCCSGGRKSGKTRGGGRRQIFRRPRPWMISH